MGKTAKKQYFTMVRQPFVCSLNAEACGVQHPLYMCEYCKIVNFVKWFACVCERTCMLNCYMLGRPLACAYMPMPPAWAFIN